MKIILVDDNEAFRKAFRNLIACEIGAEIIGEASNADEFLKIEKLTNADLIFMDIMIPGIDGVTLVKKILWQYPHLKVLAVTMHAERVYLVSLIEAGFLGCISKDKIYAELKPAIKMVLAGLRFFPQYLLLKK